MSKRRPRTPPPVEPPDEREMTGDVIRAFWDHDGPLWDDDGPLPADADWLQGVLGLSRSLAAEIEDWTQQLSDWPACDSIPTASLRRQGARIERRLAAELAGRYELR